MSPISELKGGMDSVNESLSSFIRRYRGTRAGKWGLLVPTLILITIFLIVPTILLLRYSVQPYVDGSIQTGWTLSNYTRGLTTPLYQTYLFRSVRVAFFTTLFAFLLGFPLAYTAARKGGLLGTVIVLATLAPLTIDLVIRSFGWYVLLSRGGLIQSAFALTPFFTEQTAPTLLFTEPAVIVGLTHVLLPYMVFPIISIVHTIPQSLEEAASDLGASRFTVFVKVILPLSLPGVSAGVLIVFLAAMASYVTPRLLGGTFKVLATEITRLIITSNNWPFASALAAMLVAVAVLVITLYYRTQLLIKQREEM